MTEKSDRAEKADLIARVRPEVACASLGVSRRRLTSLTKAGKIPGSIEMFPGIWTYDLAMLRALVAEREAQTCRNHPVDVRPRTTANGAATRSGGASALKV